MEFGESGVPIANVPLAVNLPVGSLHPGPTLVLGHVTVPRQNMTANSVQARQQNPSLVNLQAIVQVSLLECCSNLYYWKLRK